MRQLLRLLCLTLVLALPATGQAQDVATDAAPSVAVLSDGTLDYDAWERLARRVEDALEIGRASDVVMQELRGELVDWRDAFTTARSENAIRINTLKTQIATLGPAPEDGATEPAVLTQRREELTELLNQAQLPVRTAIEAHSRADLLVSEIDSLMRARQADQLFKLGPTPVNPTLWPGAIEDYQVTLHRAWGEVTSSWGSETQRAELRRELPLTLLLLVIGLVLITRGRAWVMRFGLNVRSRAKGSAKGVWGFLTSLGQIVAPLLGVYLLVQGLHNAGVLGLRGQILADNLLLMGLFFFGALWLGTRVFGMGDGFGAALPLGTLRDRTEGRYGAALLGLLFGLSYGLERIASYETYDDTTLAVLNFPLLLGAGFLLIRIGRLIRRSALLDVDEDGQGSFRTGLMKVLGRVVVVVGYLGPLAAAIGYTTLAGTILFPTAQTLALLALLEVLHLFFTNLYALFTRKDAAAAEQALIPTLASLAVGIAALPFLALIWGARWTDLTELWTTLGQGFALGEAQVTPRTLLTLLIVFAIGYVATRVVQGMLKSSILPRTKMDKGAQNAVSSGIGYVGIFLAVIVAITSAGIDMSSLAIVAGALSVGIGFGLQNIVSNFVSGIILLIERPISEGDWIEVGGQMGYVRDISVRSTRIETFDRSDVILPNSDLISGVVTNYTRGNSIGRVIVPVGVAYGSDTKQVEAILREVAEAHPMVTVNPAPNVYFQGFGADSLDFEIRAILRDVNFILSVKSDMNHEIARRFGEEGIEVPFAQRDIWLRNPEALAGTAAAAQTQSTAPIAPTTQSAPEALSVSDMHAETDTDTGDAND